MFWAVKRIAQVQKGRKYGGIVMSRSKPYFIFNFPRQPACSMPTRGDQIAFQIYISHADQAARPSHAYFRH